MLRINGLRILSMIEEEYISPIVIMVCTFGGDHDDDDSISNN
jgi:hypothetical protein